MDIQSEIVGDKLIAGVKVKRLLAVDTEAFKERMAALFQGHAGPVVLDLGEVEFIDSSGLGAVVALFKMRQELGGLELARLQPNVQSLLKLTKLDKVFVIHPGL